MKDLTREQLKESVYNFYHNDPFDHVLLDERDPDGNITTVLRYDEETIMVQKIDGNNADSFSYKKYPNETFLGYLQS